jgi:DNA mismatch repair protein MSH4
MAVIFLQCLSDDNYQCIYRKILSVLHDDARTAKGPEASQMQCNFAVRAGISGILDLARQTYCEIISDISGQFLSPHTLHQNK